MIKKLKDVFPNLNSLEFSETPAYKFIDVAIVKEMDGTIQTWPGKHHNVQNWVILDNGYAVAWNKSPKRNWKFPVIKFKEYSIQPDKLIIHYIAIPERKGKWKEKWLIFKDNGPVMAEFYDKNLLIEFVGRFEE